MYQLSFIVNKDYARLFEDSCESISDAVSCYEISEDSEWWTVQAIFEHKPANDVTAQIKELAQAVDTLIKDVRFEALPEKDWVTEVLKTFPPIEVGRFFVYGSHYEEALPQDKITLHIDAGMAFGSGEHATTSGCLEVLDELADGVWGKTPLSLKVLDMGCGSGILAFAAAKIWPDATVLAVDNDAKAVEVAKENANDNAVADTVQCACGDGYLTAAVSDGSPYDLIFANILANPLIVMAPSLASHLAKGGTAIISGFITSQEEEVIAAHTKQGLTLAHRIQRGDWITAVLMK